MNQALSGNYETLWNRITYEAPFYFAGDRLKEDFVNAVKGAKKHLLQYSGPSHLAFVGSLSSMNLKGFRPDMVSTLVLEALCRVCTVVVSPELRSGYTSELPSRHPRNVFLLLPICVQGLSRRFLRGVAHLR